MATVYSLEYSRYAFRCGVYFRVKFSENLVNFPLIYVIKILVVAFHKIHSHTVFATNAHVDVTLILYSVSMATLYSSVNALRYFTFFGC